MLNLANKTLWKRIGLCLVIILAGLALRRLGPSLNLPFFFWKYGGSLLWGTMVFFLVAILNLRGTRLNIAIMAALIAICVEFFRLYHTPWLDAFRLTTAGALLIGRVFSLWNLVTYAIGILLGWALDRRLVR